MIILTRHRTAFLNKDNEWEDSDGNILLKHTTLGEVIRERRLELGISQRELASRLKGDRTPFCSPQTLNNIEHNDRLGEQYWYSLSKELGIAHCVFVYYGLMVPEGYVHPFKYPLDVIEKAFDELRDTLHNHIYTL
jgi:transcriptional regulator with XRE-family HTH domain